MVSFLPPPAQRPPLPSGCPPSYPFPSTPDIECTNLSPQVGVTRTPVIDRTTTTLFVVAKTFDGALLHNRLHALDLGDGSDQLGPVNIAGSFPGGRGWQR